MFWLIKFNRAELELEGKQKSTPTCHRDTKAGLFMRFGLSTVYGLFRNGTELRGVYYKKPEVAAAACKSMGTKCDFPILLGGFIVNI